MPTVLPLTKLVDLALGTPEVGAVNFNVLHTLLHAMLAKLNLSESKAEINDSDRDFLSTNKPQRVLTALSDIDSGKGEESEDGFSVSEIDSPATSASHRSKRSSAPYHHLELRVEKLAEQLESLNALPTNADLFERAKAKGDGERPMSEMWQYMQMKKRVDANEDGVSKLMSIVEDLMKEMTSLRETNADLLSKINDLNMDDLNKRLAELEKVTNDLNDKFSTLPSADDFAQYVTWPLLEDALKGVRKDIEGLQTPDRVVVEIASQTDPKTPSRPPSSRPLSRLSTTSSGPTDSLLDVLERLGKLSEDHEALTKRVEELEEQLKNKVDKEALENLTKELASLRDEIQGLQPVVVALPSVPTMPDHTPTPVQTPPQTPPKIQSPPQSPQPQSPPPKILTPPPSKSPTPPQVRSPSPPQVKSPTPPQVKSPTPPQVKSPTPPQSPQIPTPPASPQSQTPVQSPPPSPKAQSPPESPKPTPPEPLPQIIEHKLEVIVTEPEEPEPIDEPSPPATPSVVVPPQPVVEQVLVHVPGTDLSGDMLDQLNKLKEELDALMAMRDKLPSAMSGADSLQKYASKWSSFRSMSIPASQPTSDGETSDTGTVSGSEGVEQSGSSMELMSVLRSRISDSEAFEELISRLGNLEDRFKNLHSAILNPMAMTEDSGFTSEPVSDLRSFLSDMEDKIGFLSSASSNTQLTDGTSEAEVRPKKKSKGKRKQSLSTTQETDSLEVEKTDFNQFSGIFDSDSADDDARDPAIMNAVSVEIAHTNEKLKKLGCTLDNQMGELKDKVFALDHDLKRMAKGVEFALLRSRVGGMSDMSVTASQQDHEERILKVASALPVDSRNTSLQDNRLIDNDALSRAQQAILQLQAELERLQNTTQNIISENQHRSKQIESLLTYCDTLQEKKADKDYVAMEVDVKADKRQLEGKVNHSLFDSTTNDINKLIKDILEKMDGHDSGWKDAYKQLSENVEGKLDRLEIDPLKEWLESRLKALNKKIMANANHEWGEDDAAGLRKQLIQRFNCLSCDRPVDLMPSGPVPSLPSQNGLPGTRSPRPYTTFELEQIRQHAKRLHKGVIDKSHETHSSHHLRGLLGKNMVNFERALAEKELAKMRKADLRAFLVHFGQDMEALARRHQQEQPADFGNQEVADYYATVRQCGGSHTLTYPHKRVSRMTQMNNLFKDEVAETQQQETTTPVFPIYKEEVDVQGVDGHIYRGRMERVQIEAKMPSKIPKSPGPRGPVRMIPHSESEPVGTTPAPPTHSRGRPVSARNTGSPRPGSGRPTSRPQSRPLSARNSGQESSRTTPFPDESIPMQDGEQGQTTVEAEAIRVDVPTPDVLEDPAEE